jgi:hypothetical protein
MYVFCVVVYNADNFSALWTKARKNDRHYCLNSGKIISVVDNNAEIAINAPLILKVRDIIFFFAGKKYNGAFRGIFQGGRDVFDP